MSHLLCGKQEQLCCGVSGTWLPEHGSARCCFNRQMDVQCVEPDGSNQCVFCNILGEEIQINENYFVSAPQTILDGVIGSLEPSLQIVRECLKTLVGYFAPLFSFSSIS